jgi:2-C-methyl-D-erythritol 4-phosphate cytidylyltransferase/2-C-methyl-D-erythritol 2,4-cyclodiphosphate synthase
MSVWAVIVAAGNGLRMGTATTPKVLWPIHGRPLIRWTLEVFIRNARVDGICLVTSPKLMPVMEDILRRCAKPHRLVQGGADRGASVLAGLEALPGACTWVLIHDGARPCLKEEDLERLIDSVTASGTAVAGQPVRDTLHLVDDRHAVENTPRRDRLWAVQTPQCFFRETIVSMYHKAARAGLHFTDEAALCHWAGLPVQLVETRSDNMKLTTPEDIPMLEAILEGNRRDIMRVGLGYDVHRLEENRRLILGGVVIPHTHGLAGHSDADVVTHAIMDALLGAANMGDIGMLFPSDDPSYLDADSIKLLEDVCTRLREEGWHIHNVDATITAQRPRLSGYRKAMIRRLAQAMNLEESQVSIKATTTERLGFEGREEGISAQAVALLGKTVW